MPEFIQLVHPDQEMKIPADNWQSFLKRLSALGSPRGRNVIGRGIRIRRCDRSVDLISHLVGHVKIEAQASGTRKN